MTKSTGVKPSRDEIKSKLRLLHSKQGPQAATVDAKDERRSKSKLGHLIEKIQGFFGRSRSPKKKGSGLDVGDSGSDQYSEEYMDNIGVEDQNEVGSNGLVRSK